MSSKQLTDLEFLEKTVNIMDILGKHDMITEVGYTSICHIHIILRIKFKMPKIEDLHWYIGYKEIIRKFNKELKIHNTKNRQYMELFWNEKDKSLIFNNLNELINFFDTDKVNNYLKYLIDLIYYYCYVVDMCGNFWLYMLTDLDKVRIGDNKDEKPIIKIYNDGSCKILNVKSLLSMEDYYDEPRIINYKQFVNDLTDKKFSSFEELKTYMNNLYKM